MSWFKKPFAALAEQRFESAVEIGAHALAKKALLEGMADSGMTMRLHGCTDNRGAAWGDWEISVRRVKLPASADRSGEADETREASGSAEGESAVDAQHRDAQP